MRIERLDDYQSWALHADGSTVVIDPWLLGDCTLPGGARMFRRTHRVPPAKSPEQLASVSAILLSAHFGDHFHEETLRSFPLDTPIYSTRWGVKRAASLGFRNVHTVGAGEFWMCGSMKITSIAPAFPYAHNSLGFLFESQQGVRVLLETHGVNPASIPDSSRSLDVLITAIEGVRLMGVPFTPGLERLLELVVDLAPERIVPTGTRPEWSEGFLARLLSVRGSIEEFDEMLKGTGARTRMEFLSSGAFLDLNP